MYLFLLIKIIIQLVLAVLYYIPLTCFCQMSCAILPAAPLTDKGMVEL